eukprot:g848.t1
MYWSLSDGQSVDIKSSFSFRFPCRLSRLDITRRLFYTTTKTDTKLFLGRKKIALSCSLNSKAPYSEERAEFRTEMIKFARDAAKMDDMDSFNKLAPPEVRDAMQHCITNLIGTLGPEMFDIRYTSISQHFKTLILSVIITGYMLKSAEVRMELSNTYTDKKEAALELPDEVETLAAGERDSLGSNAKNYLAYLENKIEIYENYHRFHAETTKQNSVIRYIMGLDPERLEDLAKNASNEVLLSMMICATQFVKDDIELNGNNPTVCTMRRKELTRLMQWLMNFGYHLRHKEIKYEMESSFRMDTASTSASSVLE